MRPPSPGGFGVLGLLLRRLDVHWAHKFVFKRWSLSWYIEIQNILNRENVWFYSYQAGNPEPETVHQLAFWPIGGLVIEF